MIQNLLWSCLVYSITVISFVVEAEVLKSSEFEDKEIPFLLNWKGDKQEKKHEIDGSWWRWVQEENGKTITEETTGSSHDNHGHALLFKRSVQPFRPNIDPLKTLIYSNSEHDHLAKKRWISSNFGFGSKKKTRKDSKQSNPDVRKLGPSSGNPLPKAAQEFGDYYEKGRIHKGSQYLFNERSDSNSLNSTSKMRGSADTFGQSLDLAELPKKIRPEPNKFEEKLDVGLKNRLPSERSNQIDKYEGEFRNLKMSTTPHPAYAKSSKMFGDLRSTRKLSIDPQYWNKYTTETIFDRVFEPFTELRINPQREKFPFSDMSLTSKRYSERPRIYSTMDTDFGFSKYVTPVRNREKMEFPQSNFLHFKKQNGRSDSYSNPKSYGKGMKENQNIDVFDQLSIPSMSNSDTFIEQFNKIEKISKHNFGNTNENEFHYKQRSELINNAVPSLKTQKNLKGKQISGHENLGVDYDVLLEDDEHGNTFSSFPAKLQAKSNRNHTNNITQSRDSTSDAAKGCTHHCGSGGSCGKCGGGVNISIMMPSPPVLAPTVDNSAQISHSTSASDRPKKKKERKKKPSKNIGNSVAAEPVVSKKKEKSYVKSKNVGAFGRNNVSFTAKSQLYSPPLERRDSITFGNAGGSGKFQLKNPIALSNDILKPQKHNMPYDTPQGNFSSWNYLNLMNQMQHVPPTVFGALPTVSIPPEEEDNDDELKELCDEPTSTKTEQNLIPTTRLYPGQSKPNSPFLSRDFLFRKNSGNAAEKTRVLYKLKSNYSGTKQVGQGRKSNPMAAKKIKELPAKKELSLTDTWEKYLFPKERNQESAIFRLKNEPISKGRQEFDQLIARRQHSSQGSQEYWVTNDNPQKSECYDQWEALDADLKNDLTSQGDLRVRARNRKRDVEYEENAGDFPVGYYRLSSGSSFRNPTNMVVSAFRRAKMNHEKRPVVYEEMPFEGEIINVNPTTVAPTTI